MNQPSVHSPAHLHCPPWCDSSARLLDSIRLPLRPSPTSRCLYPKHHTNYLLVITISCKGPLPPPRLLSRRHLSSHSEEQGRYLARVAESLYESQALKFKFRVNPPSDFPFVCHTPITISCKGQIGIRRTEDHVDEGGVGDGSPTHTHTHVDRAVNVSIYLL